MVERRLTARWYGAALLILPACVTGDIVLGERGSSIEPKDASARPNDASRPRARSDAGPTDSAIDSDDAGASGLDDASAQSPDSADAASAADSAAAPQRSVGCGKQPPSVDTSIQVNGMVGNYIVDKPLDYDVARPYPLVLSFRGGEVRAADFRNYVDLKGQVKSDGIVVTPDCLNDANLWDVARDSRYVEELIAKLTASYCVDEQRIFAVGHGPGGLFASALGCQLGDKLRAIAALSGAPPMNPNACVGGVAVWMSQGNAEPSGLLRLGRSNRDAWVGLNRCSPLAPSPVSPQPCVQYAGCEAGNPVVYCEYDGDLNLPEFVRNGRAIWDFLRNLP